MAEHHQHDPALAETCVESTTLYAGNFLTLKRDTVALPDGKHATREFVQHPGAVMVIPLFDDGRVLMERQYRYPLARVMTEFPAGKLDPQEGALACAIRELKEETGYTAREYVYLAQIHPVISYSTEFIDVYVARGLTAGAAQLDDGEAATRWAIANAGTLGLDPDRLLLSGDSAGAYIAVAVATKLNAERPGAVAGLDGDGGHSRAS